MSLLVQAKEFFLGPNVPAAEKTVDEKFRNASVADLAMQSLTEAGNSYKNFLFAVTGGLAFAKLSPICDWGKFARAFTTQLVAQTAISTTAKAVEQQGVEAKKTDDSDDANPKYRVTLNPTQAFLKEALEDVAIIGSNFFAQQTAGVVLNAMGKYAATFALYDYSEIALKVGQECPVLAQAAFDAGNLSKLGSLLAGFVGEEWVSAAPEIAGAAAVVGYSLWTIHQANQVKATQPETSKGMRLGSFANLASVTLGALGVTAMSDAMSTMVNKFAEVDITTNLGLAIFGGVTATYAKEAATDTYGKVTAKPKIE